MSDVFSIVILIISGLATVINVTLVTIRYKKIKFKDIMQYKDILQCNEIKHIENLKAVKKINLANSELRKANEIISEMQNENKVIRFEKGQIEELEKLVKQLDDKVESTNK